MSAFPQVYACNVLCCFLQMKRFGTEREINLDDDDIEFIVQQVRTVCVTLRKTAGHGRCWYVSACTVNVEYKTVGVASTDVRYSAIFCRCGALAVPRRTDASAGTSSSP
jgi:hypothetical protein